MKRAEVDGHSSASQWASRYEELRRVALSERTWNSEGWGMTLLVRQGIVGWMRAWPLCDGPARHEEHRPLLETSAFTPPFSALRDQLSILWANMIINQGQKGAPLW